MKDSQNKSFVLYTDYAKHIALLTNEETGELLKALFEYVEFGTQPGFSGALMMCFSFIADQIARDKEKYQDVCKKRAEAGRKGGKQKKANLANAKNETLCQSNVADTDNDNEDDNEEEHENDRNTYTKHFETFWAVYPRKADKGQCYKKYKARLKDGYSPEELLTAATAYADQCRRQRTEPQFIKHGKTFLGDSMSFTEFIPKMNMQSVEVQRQEIESNPFRKFTN